MTFSKIWKFIKQYNIIIIVFRVRHVISDFILLQKQYSPK